MPASSKITVTARAFDNGYADLLSPVAELDTLAARLLTRTGYSVTIEGFTANDRSPEYNHDFSLRRAEAVKCYLHGKGVPPSSMTTHGRGDASPLAGNDTAAGRERNQRVEVTVTHGA